MTISWNTGAAAMRFRSKSEPRADKKLITKLHKKWLRANGYKLQAASSKRQAPSAKLQAPSALKKTQLKSIVKLERL